jgi:hypothetical protein
VATAGLAMSSREVIPSVAVSADSESCTRHVLSDVSCKRVEKGSQYITKSALDAHIFDILFLHCSNSVRGTIKLDGALRELIGVCASVKNIS